MLVKLWKVTVNNWGWCEPRTFFATSREEAKKIASDYPAADAVEYAGRFGYEKACDLVGNRI